MLYKLTCNLCLILQQQHFFGIAVCTNIYHISTVGCELGIRAQGHSSWVLMQRRHDRHQPLAHPLQDFVLFSHLCRQMRGHGEHLDCVREVKQNGTEQKHNTLWQPALQHSPCKNAQSGTGSPGHLSLSGADWMLEIQEENLTWDWFPEALKHSPVMHSPFLKCCKTRTNWD